jgi:DNA-binding transcriptional MerR regulator
VKQQVPERKDIPDKVYFRIGEVSDLVGVEPHVLRYWESEFSVIRPRRAKSNQRLYRRQDVENLLLVKTLLHQQGYTISGARKLLKNQGTVEGVADQEKNEGVVKDCSSGKRLASIKKELQKIQQILALKSLRY